MKIKLENLKIRQINGLLKNYNLTATGTKAQKILALSETLKSDEVDEDELEVEPWETQINELKNMVVNLTRIVGDVANGEYGASRPEASTPQEAEVNVSTQSAFTRLQHSTQDVIGMLPEFDPVRGSTTPDQFINKVQQLQRGYLWNDEIVLFAVQHKLKGHAKIWLDSQRVFSTLGEFLLAFRRDFPDITNTADIHRELIGRKRHCNESFVDYYFTMLAKGRRGSIDDESLISYIINGINDPDTMRMLMSNNFKTCNDLFLSLQKLSKVPMNNTRGSHGFQTMNGRVDEKAGGVRPVKCFNCNDMGHIAVNCPKPSRKSRCDKCKKIGHETKDCKAQRNVSKVENLDVVKVTPEIVKPVYLCGKELTGFVDTGSDCSLIRSSAVPRDIQRDSSIERLHGFGGAVVQSIEIIRPTINFEGRDLKVELNVVPDEMILHPILVGRDILFHFNLNLGQGLFVIQSGENHKLAQDETNNLLLSKSDADCKFNINESLKEDEYGKVNQILCKFKESFSEDITNLGRSKSTTMKIDVTTEGPIVGKRYPVPFSQRNILSGIIDHLLQHDVIRPSNSPHAASVVLVEKSNGEPRMCVDYRVLNSVTVKKQFPMPIVDEQLAKLSGNKFFTTLDMTSGYYQIPLDEESRKFTSFMTHDGLFEHNVMPFGLINAPMYFQEMVLKIVAPLRNRDRIISYVDEVIIATPTADKGIEVLEEFLAAVKNEGLTLRPSKCVFLGTEVNFLGHVINEEGIRPGERKTECIRNFPTPTSVTEVRQFLGVTGYFRKFVDKYSYRAEPLTRLLKKDNEFKWQDELAKAFEFLKAAITSHPVLVLFDPGKTHEVHTDASSIGLSGILLQKEDAGMRPVFFYSRHCTEAERKYASHELEVLAIVETLERFRIYLLGFHFIIVTDCNAVATTKNTTPLPPRISRWWLRLQEFNFEIRHKAGSQMAHVDGMSRMPVLPQEVSPTVAEAVFQVKTDSDPDWILSMQLQDEKIDEIFKILRNPDHKEYKQTKLDYELYGGRLYRKVNSERKLLIPHAIRWRMTRTCHDEAGHFGLEKTVQRISKDFWFPRIRRYVKSYIAACPECCLNKIKSGKPEGELHIYEPSPLPFQCVHMDHLGPFPRSKRGNQYIIVFVCAFSKYTIIKAVRNTKTTPVITMIRDAINVFGLPHKIVTDRGTAYTSREFESYLGKYGILHVKTAVRTPRANGQAERINKTILSSIKSMTKSSKEWDETLPNLQWTINSQVNSTTKYCPNDLIFDYNWKNVSENRLVQALNNDVHNSVEHDVDIIYQAAMNITKEREKWKERYDKRHKKPHQYNEGDLVVLDHVPSATGQSHKLDPAYKGLYVVTKVIGSDRYVVEDLQDNKRKQKRYTGVHSNDHMKPWCSLSPDLDLTADTGDSSAEDE